MNESKTQAKRTRKVTPQDDCFTFCTGNNLKDPQKKRDPTTTAAFVSIVKHVTACIRERIIEELNITPHDHFF